MSAFLFPIVGGLLIGLAATLLLLWNGRVLGVSGIFGGALTVDKSDRGWRLAFLGGLLAGGFLLRLFLPSVFDDTTARGLLPTVAAGLLVGFGTSMGSGCTSGHGICGISRFSPRSIVATLIFILLGVLTATLFRELTGVM